MRLMDKSETELVLLHVCMRLIPYDYDYYFIYLSTLSIFISFILKTCSSVCRGRELPEDEEMKLSAVGISIL